MNTKETFLQLLSRGARYNAGTGLYDDTGCNGTPADAFAYVRPACSPADWEELLSLAQKAGAAVATGELCSLRYADIRLDGARYYATFHERLGRLCVSHDTVTTGDMQKISARHTKAGSAALYQLKLRFNRQCCGMCYILHLADGSLFVLDGGHPDQASDEELTELYTAMRRITGTKENEKMHIAGWFISHAHGDHLGVPAFFLRKYREMLDVEGFFFNFPSTAVLRTDGLTSQHTQWFRAAARECFPDAAVFKLHTGEELSLCGASIRVLYTHEDAADRFGRTMIGDFNSSSSVLRIDFDGIRVFFPADIHNEAEAILLAAYDAAYLRADVLQVAHHCYNSMRVLYETVGAPLMVNPQGVEFVDRDRQRSRVRTELLPYATRGFYYADRDTLKITAENGKAKIEAF